MFKKTKQFIEENRVSKVLLLQGDPGTGKSILLHQIEDYYWSHKKKGIIPFYINLTEVDNLSNVLNDLLIKQ